jgi:hypothetical protein
LPDRLLKDTWTLPIKDAGIQSQAAHFARLTVIPDRTTVENIADFVAFAVQLKNEWFPHETTWGPWFRGHADADWKLAPKLYRASVPRRGIRIIEDEIRQEFMMRAPSLTDKGPQNSWDWYFTMQHSGAPTRLLDWTEGALIALYFAVRDSQSRKRCRRVGA